MGEIVPAYRGGNSKPRVDWTIPPEHEVKQCLTLLAEEGGNAKNTADRCSVELGIPVASKDLLVWRDKVFPELWVRITEEHQQALEKVAKGQALQNSIRASGVASRAVSRIEEQIGDADIVDASKALDSLTKAQTANTDVLLKHEGRPVQGGSGESVAGLMRWFQDKGLVVDGTADEIETPAIDTTDE